MTNDEAGFGLHQQTGMDEYSLIHTKENKTNIVYATDAKAYFSCLVRAPE